MQLARCHVQLPGTPGTFLQLSQAELDAVQRDVALPAYPAPLISMMNTWCPLLIDADVGEASLDAASAGKHQATKNLPSPLPVNPSYPHP